MSTPVIRTYSRRRPTITRTSSAELLAASSALGASNGVTGGSPTLDRTGSTSTSTSASPTFAVPSSPRGSNSSTQNTQGSPSSTSSSSPSGVSFQAPASPVSPAHRNVLH